MNNNKKIDKMLKEAKEIMSNVEQNGGFTYGEEKERFEKLLEELESNFDFFNKEPVVIEAQPLEYPLVLID